MLLFYCLVLKIACVISLDSRNPDFRFVIKENDRLKEIIKINQNICNVPPPMCRCTKNEIDFIFACTFDDTADDVVFKISIFFDRWAIFKCENITSFDNVPVFTNYIHSYSVILKECIVPKNETFSQLTNKISKNISELHIRFEYSGWGLKLDQNYFKGLSNIESLYISSLNDDSFRVYVDTTKNTFDYLGNLKMLVLINIPLKDGIFDVLENLQHLGIHSDMEIDLKISDLRHQKNLTELDLNCEKMCSLDPLIFANSINLQTIKIKGNFTFIWPEKNLKQNHTLGLLNQIPEKLFAKLIDLRNVVMLYSELKVLPEDLFYNSKNIEEIELSQNQLETLPKDIFVKQMVLARLDLGQNKLKDLVVGIFDKTKNMKILILSHNELTSISRYVKIKNLLKQIQSYSILNRSVFARLKKLEKLYLDNNKIKTINNSFKTLINLQQIDLQHNQILDDELNECFEKLKNLKKLYLSYNNLSYFIISNQTYFRNIEILDLSHNNISKLNLDNFSITFSPVYCFIDLSFNNFTEFDVQTLQTFSIRANVLITNGPIILLKLNENPIICDCNALELIDFVNKKTKPNIIYNFFTLNANELKCHKPNHLSGRLLRKTSITELICNIEHDCPEKCKCKQRSVDDTLIIECSSTQLQELPTLPQFEELNLTRVELYAADNKINSIQLNNIPDDLKLLDLRNNSLRKLSNIILKRFETIDELHLSGNLWTC